MTVRIAKVTIRAACREPRGGGAILVGCPGAAGPEADAGRRRPRAGAGSLFTSEAPPWLLLAGWCVVSFLVTWRVLNRRA